MIIHEVTKIKAIFFALIMKEIKIMTGYWCVTNTININEHNSWGSN